MTKKTKQARSFPIGDKPMHWEVRSCDPAYLKEWRESLGVSQPQLAKEAGVSKALIALIENGQRPLVGESREDIWGAIQAFARHQALNPSEASPAFKFWATFFGPDESGSIIALDRTPAQRVRNYARAAVYKLQ